MATQKSRWETLDEDFITVSDIEEDELFVTQTDLVRWKRGKVPTPRVLRRTDDPYRSITQSGGVVDFPVNTSPSHKAVRVRQIPHTIEKEESHDG